MNHYKKQIIKDQLLIKTEINMNPVYKKINNFFSKDDSNKNLESKLSSNLKKIIKSRAIIKENVKNIISFSKPILRIVTQPLFLSKNN